MLGAIRLLNLRRLARQPLRTGLAILAVAAGSSLLVGLLITIRSVNGSIDDYEHRLAGPTPLRVIGPMAWAGLDERVTDVVRATPGVAAAIPITQAVTIAETASGHDTYLVALGIDCSIEAVIGKVGCSPAGIASADANTPPFISRALARSLGPNAVIRSDAGRMALTNAPPLAQLDTINHGRVAVFALPTAQARFHRVGRLDAIYVQPAPGANVAELRHRLAARVGSWNTVLGASDPTPGPNLFALFGPLLGLIGLLALGIGGLLVFNIVTLSLTERRRELALGSALGATRRLVVTGVLAEAAVIGAVGGIAGAVFGIAVAHQVIAAIGKSISQVSGITLTVHRGGPTPLIGVIVGVAVAAIASFVPARRATRVDVSAELQGRAHIEETSARRGAWRVLIALAAFAIGLAMCTVSARGGGIERWQGIVGELGLLLAVLGGLLAVGLGTPLVASVLPRLTERLTGVTRLATTDAARQSTRTTAIALAIGGSLGLAGVLASLIPAVHDGTVQFVKGEVMQSVWVSGLPFNNAAAIDAKVSPQVAAALEQLPGASGMARSIFIYLVGHGQPVAIAANEQMTGNEFTVLSGSNASEAFARNEVVVGPALACSMHLRRGSTLRLPTPTGWTTLKVGGVIGYPNANGFAVLMPIDRLEANWGAVDGETLFVRPAPGLDVNTLARRIERAHLDPDLHAYTPAQVVDGFSRDIDDQMRPFWVLQQSLLLVALIATASTLLLAGVQRRRQLGVLAAVGMPPLDLGRLALAEAALVGLLAGALGIVASLGIFEALREIAIVFIGIHAPFRVNLPLDVLYLGLALVTVLIGAALPAWRTSRLEVVDALRYE